MGVHGFEHCWVPCDVLACLKLEVLAAIHERGTEYLNGLSTRIKAIFEEIVVLILPNNALFGNILPINLNPVLQVVESVPPFLLVLQKVIL